MHTVTNLTPTAASPTTEQPKALNRMEAERCELRRRMAVRLKHARDEAGINQDTLAKMLSLTHAQTISQMESGEREISPDELVKAAKALKKPVDFFIDPTLLVGEGIFSWRSSAKAGLLKKYELKSSRMIAAWREANRAMSGKFTPFKQTIALGSQSSYEEAWHAADEIRKEWNLGPFPSAKLSCKIEEELNILVLNVDAPKNISGAACWLKEFGAILINRTESAGRRNFDLAHELFHLLTWHAMPPQHIDLLAGARRSPVEVLADNFAGALLMPTESVREVFSQKGTRSLEEWIPETASVFGVSALAFYWRLVALRMIKRASVNQSALRCKPQKPTEKDRLYSYKFLSKIHEAINRGFFSVARVCELLEVDRESLQELLDAYGLAKV